jgi:hypothetical protein
MVNNDTEEERERWYWIRIRVIVVILVILISTAIYLILAYNNPPNIIDKRITEITDNSATIAWVTDKDSSSQVTYCGPDGMCRYTENDQQLVKLHALTIKDLKVNTTYHVTIQSRDHRERGALAEMELTTKIK